MRLFAKSALTEENVKNKDTIVKDKNLQFKSYIILQITFIPERGANKVKFVMIMTIILVVTLNMSMCTCVKM